MRFAAGLIFASAVSLCVSGSAWSQTAAPKPQRLHPQAAPAPGRRGQAPAAAPAPAPAMRRRLRCPRPPAPIPTRSASHASVEIDTTGGPGFGFEHFKQLDFLRDHEVVLTFDDGPWPVNTPAVLKALADECTTGIFFSIGKHATYYPEILKAGAGGRSHHRIATPGRMPR